MKITACDLVITDDGAKWQVHSVTDDGKRRSFVARHVSSPRVLSGDIARLTWSAPDGAWRLKNPGTPA